MNRDTLLDIYSTISNNGLELSNEELYNIIIKTYPELIDDKDEETYIDPSIY